MTILKREFELVKRYQKKMKEILKQVKTLNHQIKEIKVFNLKLIINNLLMI